MKKNLYIFFLLLVSNQALAQRKFNEREWEEWDQAALQLEIGNFDKAIGIYRLEPSNPGFSNRIKQTQNLKTLYSEGLKLQRERKYLEAITMFKRHRGIEGIGSLGIFEKKIDECVRQLGTPDNSRLKDLERRDVAAEYSYKAYKKLLVMDTQGALRDFDLAKKFGNTASVSLKEKYKNDLQMIQEVIQWQQVTQKIAGKGLEQEKVGFAKYRDIKNVPVLPSIETHIQIVVAQIEGKNVLLNFAQNCETDALLAYVQEHKSELNQSETLVSKLRQYKSIRNKIDTLSGRLDNSSTVKSAFSSIEKMTNSFTELPDDVKKSLETCLKNDKHRVFMGYSAIAAKENNYVIAQSFLDEAKELSLPEKKMEIAGRQADLTAQKSKSELTEVNSKTEKANDVKIGKKLENIKNLIENGKCREAKIQIENFKKAFLLNSKQANDLTKIENSINSCQSAELKFGIIAGASANKPKYKINNDFQHMSYGRAIEAGIALSIRDHGSPVSLLASLKYFNTNYNSLTSDNLAIENFKISGAIGSINIKLVPIKFQNGGIFVMVGAEGVIPVTYKYNNFSAGFELSDRAQLNSFLLSGQAGVGAEFGRFFIEGFANYGVNGIYDKSSKNPSSTQNQRVDARFRRAGIRIGFWLF